MSKRDNAVRNTWDIRKLLRAARTPLLRGHLAGNYVLARLWLKANPRRAHSKALRAHYGSDCPCCWLKRPKAIPTVMLPGQTCKVCGHRDPRPRLTAEQVESATKFLRDESTLAEGETE